MEQNLRHRPSGRKYRRTDGGIFAQKSTKSSFYHPNTHLVTQLPLLPPPPRLRLPGCPSVNALIYNGVQKRVLCIKNNLGPSLATPLSWPGAFTRTDRGGDGVKEVELFLLDKREIRLDSQSSPPPSTNTCLPLTTQQLID